MARIKWSPLKLGLEASEDPQVLQAARKGSEGIVYARYLTSTEDFARKFTERLKREPALPAALAYDAVNVEAYAMNQSGNSSADELARTLGRTRNFSGASGPVEFAEGTRVQRPVELWTIENGVPVRLTKG